MNESSNAPEFYKSKEEIPQGAHFVDAFEHQVKELFFIENHQFIGQKKSEVYATKDFSEYAKKKSQDYVFAYFPWNNHAVKTVQKDDYLKLKTNRNQDLITADEQSKLRDFTIAVLGLSVGSNIAFVLSQAGISNEIYLADFDDLDTTNLNRILAGVHQVGVNKTVVAARRIYEDNPFAQVHPMSKGVTHDNLESLLKEGKLKCIVEEIDEMQMKITSRLLAIKYKVPVVMITDNGDGVVLHVERYDLGHDKIFGQTPAYWEEIHFDSITREEAGKFIVGSIVGGPDKVDPLMMASIPRVIKKELVSWPQLGSAALLGGVIATVAIKRIASGASTEKDIRSYVHPVSGISNSTH